MKKIKNNKGFTLVELIVVMAIMAILVGALAPQVVKYVEKARESKDLQVLNTVYTAVNTAIASSESTVSSIDDVNLETTLGMSFGKTAIGLLANDTTTAANTAILVQGKFVSKAAKTNKIFINYDSATGVLKVYVSDQTSPEVTNAAHVKLGPVSN